MKKTFLIIILTIGLFLRTYKLGTYPVGFLWDEAALGYNSFSILHTGRDEYGQTLPLIFKSFGDYKPGLYVYSDLPLIAIFGLNEFAVRLPSALAGVLAIYLFYLLVKRQGNEELALIGALLLAINPWHLNFSRGAWELNLMLTELLAMLLFWDRYLQNKRAKDGLMTIIMFVLSLFTYQAAKFVSPLLLLAYLFFYSGKIVLNFKRNYPMLILVGSIFVVFNGMTFFSGQGGRLKAMSLFSYPRSSEEFSMLLRQDNGNQAVYGIFHSPIVFFTRSVLGRYFNHFSGRFLFFDGDWSNPRNGVIYHGVLYLVDVTFLVLGLYYLFRKKRTGLDNFMLFWLLLAPLPSALSRDSISAVRSYTMVIPLVFIISAGLDSSIKLITDYRLLITAKALLFTCYLFSFIRLTDLYFVHTPIDTSQDRLYGYREAVNYLAENMKGKDKIIFTDKYGQPYIFYLFYNAYNPTEYQEQALLVENKSGDVGRVDRLDNIEFRQIYWPDDRGIGNSMFIGTDMELPLKDVTDEPEKYIVADEIKFLNNNTAFRIVETK